MDEGEKGQVAADDRWFSVPQAAEILEVGEIALRSRMTLDNPPAPGKVHGYFEPLRRNVWRIPIPEIERLIVEAGDPPRLRRRLAKAIAERWGGDAPPKSGQGHKR